MEDKKKTELVSGEKQVCSAHVEPLIKKTYTLKALQSSNQPDTLTWDSVGDQATYNASGATIMQEWKRHCIYLCSSGEFGDKPGFFITDYDGYFDLPAEGNMLFKAAMSKLEYDVALPPFTSAMIEVKILLACTKISDSNSSSTWVGGVSMKCDHCKTIGKNNKESGVWSGVPSSDLYYSAENNSPAIDLHCLGTTNYKRTVDNTSDRARHQLLDPIYLMSMLERPKSYPTRLGLGDTRPALDYIIVSPQFTSLISYNSNEVQNYTYSDRKTKGISLKKPERIGYVMKGWLDSATGRLYPAGGYYAEKRGINLTEQWIEDVVPYKVVHHYAQNEGPEKKLVETHYYIAGATICPLPDQNYRYETPEPITVSVEADGSTVVEYNYKIKKYPVQYLANGGCFSSGKDIETQECRFGMPIDILREKPTRTGYLFSEWDPYPAYVDTGYSIVTRAKWIANKYTVKYDKNDDNATEVMEPQGLVYDQPQQLRKNEYKCKHTVSFAVGDRRGDNAYFQPQTAECQFMGWAEKATGEKAYDDGATVCNLTSERDGEVTLYAVWKFASILLPQLQIYHEGFYFDAWYLDEACTKKAGEPGSMYIPTQSETLYGKVVCTGVKNLRWVQGEEDLDKRTIAAEWDEMKEATAYRVGLENNVKKVNYPFHEEDFEGDGVKFIDAGTVEVKGCRLDLTKTLKRFTAGGDFNFSVVPVIPNFPQENIRRTVSPAITTLARPNETDMRWDGTKAVWKKIEGASFYLLDLLSKNNRSLSEMGYQYPRYALTAHGKYALVEASGNIEESVEVGALFNALGDGIKFGVLAYSDATYTPQYEWPIGEYYDPF